MTRLPQILRTHIFQLMVAASAVLGISGFIMAFALFLSPIPMFKRILKEKNTFEFSQVSFLTQLVESFHWSLWCTTLPDRMELLYTNIVGIAIMLTYASIFMFYAQRQEGPARKVINLQAWLALFLILVGVVVFFTVESTLSQTILVSGAVFYNILKYSAPLSVAQLVISSKSVEFMPLSLTLAGLVCSSLWGLYGLVLNDYWLVVPNALGFLCSIAQAVLYVWVWYFYGSSGAGAEVKGSERNRDVSMKGEESKEEPDADISCSAETLEAKVADIEMV